MKSTNLQLFDNTRIPIFVLTYIGVGYFTNWSREIRTNPHVQFVIVDNGNQDLSGLYLPTVQTSQNLGCAGGWNLISQLAFNKFGLDKIIIAQDDAMFDLPIAMDVWNNTTDEIIAGAYDRSFEFSLFGITRNMWNTVGMFDENFIYVGCEDNDYKHRMKLLDKKVISLGYSADMNFSLSSRYITSNAKPANEYNVQFIEAKWGKNYEYTHPFNDPTRSINVHQIYNGLVDVYGNIDKFPSILEFEKIS